jgi:hypothetical protein
VEIKARLAQILSIVGYVAMAFRTSRLLTGSLQNLNTLCNTVSHSSNSINRRLSYLANRGANICLDTHPHTGIKNKDAIVATQWCIQIRHKGRDKPKKSEFMIHLYL